MNYLKNLVDKLHDIVIEYNFDFHSITLKEEFGVALVPTNDDIEYTRVVLYPDTRRGLINILTRKLIKRGRVVNKFSINFYSCKELNSNDFSLRGTISNALHDYGYSISIFNHRNIEELIFLEDFDCILSEVFNDYYTDKLDKTDFILKLESIFNRYYVLFHNNDEIKESDTVVIETSVGSIVKNKKELLDNVTDLNIIRLLHSTHSLNNDKLWSVIYDKLYSGSPFKFEFKEGILFLVD